MKLRLTCLVLTTLAATALASFAHAAGGGSSGATLDALAREHACLAGRLERAKLSAAAPLDDRWEERTGEDLRNYPPDRKVDHQHMRLEIDIPDMNERRFTAVETLTFQPIAKPLESLTLDAALLQIQSVEVLGRNGAVSWSHDGRDLQMAFDPALPAASPHDLRIRYTLEDPVDGLFWFPEHPARPGRAARAAQIHTQGEPETSQYWFVCHDSPNERLTTELIVTVPEGYTVSSNGELAMQRTTGGRTTFHWRQEPDHVNYLVSLIVGKFDIVDVGDGDLAMPVYVPPGWGHMVQQTYGRTPDMVRVFEERFDEPYPWARYAQLLAWNFQAGGMENTAATTMYDTAVLDEKALRDGDLDGLISHELGHQWFGDLLTCEHWAEIWLNEGFATYSEALWFEVRDGYDDGYLYDMWRNVRRSAAFDSINPGNESGGLRPGMVSHIYEDPNDVFRRRSNPYPKGGSILHMLRMKLGDQIFFDAVAEYIDRHKFDTVETHELRTVFEDVSGLSLGRFFDQWTRRPGTPQVEVDVHWSEADKELTLVVEQTQRIDGHVPAFVFDLPIHIQTPQGPTEVVTMDISERRHQETVELDQAPEMVIVDPKISVLMSLEVDQPASRFIAQLRRGPTVPARLDAAGALERRAGGPTRDALVQSVRDSDEHHAVRSAAADALGALEETDALLELVEENLGDARVRHSVVDALRGIGAEESLETFARIAADESAGYAVRSEALRAVGEMGDRQHLSILLAALESESQHDQVRGAALRALVDLDEPEGLDAATRFTEPGWLPRLRPTAIGAVAALADHDKEKAYDAMIPILDDLEPSARRAAGGALVEIEDERALPKLRRLAASDPHPGFRESAGRWADQLAAALRADEPLDDLREDVERLHREIEELKAAQPSDF